MYLSHDEEIWEFQASHTKYLGHLCGSSCSLQWMTWPNLALCQIPLPLSNRLLLAVSWLSQPPLLHSFHSSLTHHHLILFLRFSKWPSGCERQKNEKARDFDFSSRLGLSFSFPSHSIQCSAARAVPCFSVPCSVSPSLRLPFLVSDGAGRPPRPIWPRPSGQSSSSRKERKGGNANARKKRNGEWGAGKEDWVRRGRGKEKKEEGKQALARSQNHDKCKQPAQRGEKWMDSREKTRKEFAKLWLYS